jgi:hypothetical protein
VILIGPHHPFAELALVESLLKLARYVSPPYLGLPEFRWVD